MTLYKKFLTAAFFAVLMAFAYAPAAQAYYYINNEGEYSIWLPDAPTGQSIWADGDDKIPLLDKPPKFGTLGEYAEVLRTDPDTGDTFDVHITFLKADRDFLLSLTKEKMYKALHDAFSDTQLSNTEEHFSQGTDTLKWATYIGYSVDKNNNLHYNAAHYLTGQSTIELVRISYSLDNKTYQAYYDKLLKSIKYTGK